MKVYRLVGQAVCNYVTAFKMKLYRFPCFSKKKKKGRKTKEARKKRIRTKVLCYSLTGALDQVVSEWYKQYLDAQTR